MGNLKKTGTFTSHLQARLLFKKKVYSNDNRDISIFFPLVTVNEQQV